VSIKYIANDFTNPSLSRDLIILTIDNKELFISEIKNFGKTHSSLFENEINFTIHSNSRSLVTTYNAILEMLWRQDELYQKSEMAITKLQLQEKLQQELIHNFANGLRNPIQPILGFSEILLDKKDHFKKYGDILEIINVCAQKLAKHVNNMIDIAEIENDTFILNKETFDLIKFVNDIIERYKKNSFSTNNKNIDISSSFGSLLIHADKNRMKFTIENLITNAIDVPGYFFLVCFLNLLLIHEMT
jgi:signal transduction histidine kinase